MPGPEVARFATPSGWPPWPMLLAVLSVGATALATLPLLEIRLAILARAPHATWDFLRQTLVAPDWSYLPTLGRSLLQTVEMAYLATGIAMLASLPVGLLAARTTTPHGIVGVATREVLTWMRAVPELVWALLFVAALGLGPLPGVMAMALVSLGFMGRFVAEAYEVVDPRPVEAVAVHGAGWLQVRTFAVLPLAMPDLITSAFYLLDHNIRQSAIIGLVGAGGIGYEIVMAMHLYELDRLPLLLLAIVLTVWAIETTGQWVRRKVI